MRRGTTSAVGMGNCLKMDVGVRRIELSWITRHCRSAWDGTCSVSPGEWTREVFVNGGGSPACGEKVR